MTKSKLKTKFLGLLMAVVMTFPCISGGIGGFTAAAEGSGTADGSVAIDNLKVNGSESPLGIDDVSPVFSWELSSSARGKSQSAYRLVVKDGEETVWDSHKTASENNYGVVYGGTTALKSKTEYNWTVTVWDESGKSVEASSTFETGIMSDAEWNSEWIGQPSLRTEMNFNGASWLWDRSGRQGVQENTIPAETRYFRRAFTVPSGKNISYVQIAVSADDIATIYLNGTAVLFTPDETDAWMNASVATVSGDVLNEGTNVIAAEAANALNGYAGMLVKMEICYTDSTVDTIVTDGQWKIGSVEQDGWTEAGFDDSSWKTPSGNDAILYGNDPWGDRVSFSSSDRSAPLLRKQFTVDNTKKVSKARAYIAGLGLYELKINGSNPADSVLNPANTDYDDTVLYNVYDVTDLISGGANAVCVELGNGFYNESITGWNWNNAPWRDLPKLRFELDITYSDGTVQHIKSDSSWKLSSDGPTTSNSIYSGETFDARKDGDFSSSAYNDSAWQNAGIVSAPSGKLTWQDMEPIRKTGFFGSGEGAEGALDVTYSATNSKYTVKVPRNIAGWSRIVFRNTTAGQAITIDYAETLASDGNLNLKTESDGVTQRDVYICKGGAEEVYEPKFNYKGFQYVQISGYDGQLTADDVTCYIIHNDVEQTSSFNTSDEMLNTMHSLMVNTLLNNFHGKPTDTPWLEKNGWLGDVNVALGTMGYNFDIARFMVKFLGDIRDSQTASGNVPQFVPNSGLANTANAPVWNTVYIFAVEELCDTYGMNWLVAEYYDSMKKLADLDISSLKGSQWIWSDQYLLGDWSSPVSTPGNGEVSYDEEPVEGGALAATAYVYSMLGVMAEYAQSLDKPDDVAYFNDARANILSAFNARYLKDGYYETTEWAGNHAHDRTKYRQSSNILPLAFGMVPEESRAAVVQNLVNDIISKDYHLDTGIIGTRYILPVLCDNGYEDIAYRILKQTTYPSWGYWLEQGATSLWEMWESTSRSRNHYFLGTYDEWFFSYIGGIRDVEDGYRTFTIDPTLIGDLRSADISLDTVRGELAVKWQYAENDCAQFEITVPFGSTATLRLPTAYSDKVTLDGKALSVDAEGVEKVALSDGRVEVTLGSGSYTFVSPLDARRVYTGELSSAVGYAQGLQEADYRAEGWSQFVAVLEEAQAVLADNSATQSQINTAAEKLIDATKALQEYVNQNRVALKAKVQEILSCGVMNLSYTTGALRTFQDALSQANKATLNASLDETEMAAELAAFDDALSLLLSSCKSNLARVSTARVTASSSVTSANDGWGLEYLTDGNTGYSGGWSSANLTTQQHEEWVQIDFGFAYMFDKVTIYSSATSADAVSYGMPLDFVIEVSDDGENYTTVYSEQNYQPVQVGAHEFSFDSVTARYVRIRGTRLNRLPHESNVYRMQLAEIQVTNTPRADMSALAALMERYDSLDRSLYTSDSLLVLEDAVSSALALMNGTVYESDQAKVDAAASALEAALDGLQLKDGGTVTPPDPGTDPGTEPDPAPQQGPNIWAIVGGVCGGVVVVAAAVAAIVLVRRRKRK